MPLEQVSLGRSGLRLSQLGIGTGTGAADCQSRQSKQDPEALAALLVAASHLGVTWWDTSDDYDTHRHVRCAISQVERTGVQISSKTHAATELTALRAVERALAELGLEHIDLFFLHDVDDPAEIARRSGAMAGLLKARQEG
ncbi:MAG: aldo/keto reductase, partial [Cyanobacteria bacterium REEB65]|nr:aldo/keto reductase [Cyanobacteria bacterium REEB65]